MAGTSRHIPEVVGRARTSATRSTRDQVREALPMLVLIGLTVVSVAVAGLWTLISEIG